MDAELLVQIKQEMRQDVQFVYDLMNCATAKEFQAVMERKGFYISLAECGEILKTFQTGSDEISQEDLDQFSGGVSVLNQMEKIFLKISSKYTPESSHKRED